MWPWWAKGQKDCKGQNGQNVLGWCPRKHFPNVVKQISGKEGSFLANQVWKNFLAKYIGPIHLLNTRKYCGNTCKY